MRRRRDPHGGAVNGATTGAGRTRTGRGSERGSTKGAVFGSAKPKSDSTKKKPKRKS